ncbi:type II toxin-antitoxin system Phd/YefM family antitoxin [Elusimicrobiota bacterium]
MARVKHGLDKYVIMYYTMCRIKYNMATNILPASELRTQWARILAKIREEGAACYITKNGRAVAALLPIELYDELISALEDRFDEEDASLASEVREARKEYKAGKTVPLSKLRRLLRP